MNEPEESRQRVDGIVESGGTDEAGSPESGEAPFRDRHGDVETPELSGAGVGLGVGEPNTFEPEEAAPAVDGRTD